MPLWAIWLSCLIAFTKLVHPNKHFPVSNSSGIIWDILQDQCEIFSAENDYFSCERCYIWNRSVKQRQYVCTTVLLQPLPMLFQLGGLFGVKYWHNVQNFRKTNVCKRWIKKLSFFLLDVLTKSVASRIKLVFIRQFFVIQIFCMTVYGRTIAVIDLNTKFAIVLSVPLRHFDFFCTWLFQTTAIFTLIFHRWTKF